MRHAQSVLFAIAVCLAVQGGARAAETPALRHGYVDDRYGQLHYATAAPREASSLPPIVLLHQSPNSSVEFDALTVALGRSRVVIAIDTPGHGGSDGPAAQPTLEDYAAAIAEGLKGLGYGPGKPVDVFGYHTGSKIATELAVNEPAMVRRIMLSGIFDPPAERVADALANLHHPQSAYDMLSRFGRRLDETKARSETQGLTDAQWGRIRIDSLRAMTRQEFGHEAAFRYAAKFKTRMRQVKQPVLLVPMDDGLAQETRDARANFADAQVTAQTFAAGAFFTQTEAVAAALNAFSSAP